MGINEIVEELNLEFYGYNEDEKAFVTWTDCQGTYSEFNKIVDMLKEHNIAHEVVNYSYIKIND